MGVFDSIYISKTIRNSGPRGLSASGGVYIHVPYIEPVFSHNF